MSEKIACTVGILTKNSAATLERALKSVQDFSEIIICDGGSTDATLDIAAKYGARVIPQSKDFLDAEGYINNFSGVRNQTLEAASNNWYFFVDSDEYVSPELVASVRTVAATRHEGAFNVFRRYVLRGKEVQCSASYPNRSMRFFSKRSVIRFRKIVHERPMLRDGATAEDLNVKLYVPVEEDRSKVWERNRRYIALEVKRKGRVGLFRYLAYARGELRASASYLVRLIYGYIFCRGTRLPLSMELARHRYPIQLFAALWRARSFKYPPTVLFLVNKWKTGGAEHVFLQEFEALREEHINVRFGVVYGEAHLSSVEEGLQIKPRFKSLYDIAAYIRLLRRLSDEGVTHIVATLEHAIIVARIAALFAPSVHVTIIESGMADRKPLRYKALDLLMNWRCAAIVAGSTGVLKSLRYQLFYANKMHVLLNGVDVPDEIPTRKEPERFTLLAVGSLRSEKGFDILLDAFAGCAKEADSELIIAGQGILEHQLKERAHTLGISSRVRFLGERPHQEVLAMYPNVHCFVLSSVSEGNPTVVMEALAHGTPVIATRVPGVVDYIEDGLSGILVPIGSSEALAHAMSAIYADSALRKRLGTAGYQLAKQRLSLQAHIRGLRSVLGI